MFSKVTITTNVSSPSESGFIKVIKEQNKEPGYVKVSSSPN